MKSRQTGFTLVEIAIVLVIIGLLLGGVLKGQELINSAKVKNLANDFRNIPIYIYGYQDRFRALPGDDVNVTTHLAGATKASSGGGGGVGDGVINGAWFSATNTEETFLFWQHVRLAGFAPGSTDIDNLDAYIPRNAEGGRIGVTGANNPPIKDANGNNLRGTFFICSANISGKFAKQLDMMMDDGNTATGSMMTAANQTVTGNATPTSAVATANIDDGTPYMVCMGI
ncbi:prepilin-type N-terminal cleavage/methylation domain-containing protein [Azonexus sp.]|jgi:prepilin-type N-terminal cleavage/methylation domain-containing protein|uniref:prepilin-type N-terminal cleavage/methylation domain-containing protein n=1 Tax=Azonexus sp. TaxID=1872668 RepID=UPI00281F1076|nr:prepilin-type N-terminal cleavage/methylation domain-containing protein [Azonexus sp.]MDR1996304.1 prepilin-type N-terminal cleavage/methylation domain-containing protein [Azonexus sp.]